MVTTRKRSLVTPSPSLQSPDHRRAKQNMNDILSNVRSQTWTMKEKVKEVILTIFRRMNNGIWFCILQETDKIDDIYVATGVDHELMSNCLLFMGLL